MGKMASAVFIAHFVLLFTFGYCSILRDKTALHEDDHSLPESEEQSELLDHNFGKNSILQERYKCHLCEGQDCDGHPSVCENAILCWKSSVRESDGKKRVSRGCTRKADQARLYCNPANNNARANGSQYCMECCQGDMCNGGPFPVLEDYQIEEDENRILKISIGIVGSILGLGIGIGGFVLYFLSRKKNRKRSLAPRRNKLLVDSDIEPSILAFSSPSTTYPCYPNELRATAAGDSTLKEYLEGQSLTSGSGSGLPLLVQRTLAKQVALVECLSSGGGGGGGGFGGEVWRGVWHGENVAVKIYFSRDEAAWARETEVYSQFLPSRHENILGYVGSDMTSRASCTQLWLVTHYHPLGSLFDHLNRSPHPLNHHQAFNICLSIANGLLYLHTEIHGTRGKPAMAHRNLKSKNILVKSNGACVIADLALAVTQDRLNADQVDIRQGTKRYMSPELLEQSIDATCLESFRRADMYSMGLILWEVCRRCISNGVALEYTTPYSEWLANGNQEPSVEEMRKLVVIDQRRPPIPNRWHSDQTLFGMGKLMRECWHSKPAARLAILRVKKTLVKLAANDSRINLPLD